MIGPGFAYFQSSFEYITYQELLKYFEYTY